jgi:hypothetical protein
VRRGIGEPAGVLLTFRGCRLLRPEIATVVSESEATFSWREELLKVWA